jgi:hypothetical protein
MNKKQIRNKIIIFSGSVVLCLFLLFGWKYGWFKWQQLEKPPEKVAKFIAIKDTSIWIKGSSGKIYFNSNSYACQNDCWVVVTDPPTEAFLQEGRFYIIRKGTTCSYPPPLIGVIDSMAECRWMEYSDQDSLYVLRFDGNLFAWHYDSGQEFSPLVNIPFYFLILAIVIFSLVIVSKWFDKINNLK